MKNKLSFLKPIFSFLGIGIIITTISRLTIFFLFKERIQETENFWYIFPIGLRFDLIILCYLAILPATLICLLPNKLLKYLNKAISIYLIIGLFLVLLMELSTPNFITQYDTRPNRLFLDYLIYPKEVFGTLLKGYLGSIILSFVILSVFTYVLYRFRKKLFYVYEKVDQTYHPKLILFPIIGFLLFFGIRSSLTSIRPINASNAVFSSDQLTNAIGLNSLYSVAFATYGIKYESDITKMYGKMEEEEAYLRVKKYMQPSVFTDSEIPFLHKETLDSIKDKPYNLVIFLQESLGAEYVGSLGGLPLTPEFDKLTQEGLLFTNLYSTGTRSVRGIEAIVTGFLPSPMESVVKMSNSQSGFFTLASLLKDEGYDTSFIYGGMANFDNMASFFNGNGFKHIIDEPDFDEDGNKYAFKGIWGYSDEDLVLKANQYFKSLGKKPFFSLVFSTSNHEPFEFPDNRIELYDQKKNTVNNAIKYADYAIGKFFELAKKEDYYENTVFIVIADHNRRTYGKNLVPINKFKIPALIIAPNVKKGVQFDKLSSQIDIPTSLLSLVGLEAETPMPGRNIFKLNKDTPGRAIMQFHDINAFRVEDQVIIIQPHKNPLQFRIINDSTLIETALDTELARDALAHVVSAQYLYSKRKHTNKKSL